MILVVCGPGGVGKGTVLRRLIERDPALWLSRSWTTRARRPGEAADAYIFVDRSTFEAEARSGGFLEWATVVDELYGTPVPDAPSGTDLLLEIDVQGAKQVLARCDDVVCVLLTGPSEEAAAARMRARGDSEEKVAQRIILGRHEIEEARKFATHVVVNDQLERAVDEMQHIIEVERKARQGPDGPDGVGDGRPGAV